MTIRTLALLTLSLTPLLAHDMWIEPATFHPAIGDITSLRLLVGQGMLGDPLPRSSQLIKQFVFEDPQGRKPVFGREGHNPAGFIRATQPGFMVVGFYSNPTPLEQPAEKFNSYLKEEGLDAIVQQRAKSPDSSSVVHEMFSRCAKSLLLAGAAATTQTDKILGFPLELLAERNPYALAAGEQLPVRLTYENKPLPGALVIAVNKRRPSEKISARTDKAGRVLLALSPGGMWLVKAVHMIPAPVGMDAQWHSYWASLTFEVAGQ